MLTILTATYNRADKLRKLYSSLLAQTDCDFEWIIADDGSHDGTQTLAADFKINAGFPVIYLSLPHGGKHRAVNAGVKAASGDYIVIMDSDDYFLEDSVAVIKKRIEQTDGQEHIAGIMLSQYMQKDGRRTVNGSFPSNREYADLYNYNRNTGKYRGDRLEVIRRELMLKYPFPEFEGEYFVTESAVWNKMSADGYKFRIYKDAVCVIEYLDDGLTGSYKKVRIDNYRGFVYAIKAMCDVCPVYKCFWVVRNYAVISREKGVGAKEAARDVGIRPCIIRLMRLF